MEKLVEILPFIIPILIVHLVLAVFTLVKLKQANRVRMNNKIVWVIIILLINLLGSIVFLTAGRLPDEDSSNN